MQCTELQQRIDDRLDKQLSEAECAEMDTHLEHCADCRCAVVEEEQLREALRDMPIPDASAGFAARALRRAAAANAFNHQPVRNRAFMGGFAAALVAGIVLWFVSGVYGPNGEIGTSQPQLAELSISLHETRRVKLSFNAPERMEKVRVSLVLPEHVELEGYPGRKQIAWYTNLRKGDNVLTLPISALRSDKGVFTAKVGNGKTVKQIQFNLNVESPGVSTLEVLKSA